MNRDENVRLAIILLLLQQLLYFSDFPSFFKLKIILKLKAVNSNWARGSKGNPTNSFNINEMKIISLSVEQQK